MMVFVLVVVIAALVLGILFMTTGREALDDAASGMRASEFTPAGGRC
ncbi:hypothetical protein AB0C21_05475 [Spirillospora sp. NPDC049024]